MSLSEIVKALGGEQQGKRRAVIPGPGHSKSDRSVSLLVDESGRLVVRSWGRSTWQEVLDDLRSRNFIDGNNRLSGMGVGEGYHGPDASPADKVRCAAAIWGEAAPAAATLSERHARLRGITRPLPGPDVLRHAPRAPLRAYDPADGRTHAAMVAAITSPEGSLTAIELTYLDRQGARDGRIRPARKTVGSVPPRSAVRIDPPDTEMLVAEGFFTTLDATDLFSLPGWATLSTARMRTWSPPPGVLSVLVAGDNGIDGRRSAFVLVRRLRAKGVRSRAVFPPLSFDDFNTYACARRAGGAPKTEVRA